MTSRDTADLWLVGSGPRMRSTYPTVFRPSLPAGWAIMRLMRLYCRHSISHKLIVRPMDPISGVLATWSFTGLNGSHPGHSTSYVHHRYVFSVPGRKISHLQLAAISTGLALLPSIVILTYASWTAGPGDRKTSPASVKLVPTALFTSALGLLLFLPSSKPSDYVAALVPLALMTCMRGGKDDVGDDDDGWQWLVLVHNTVAFM